MFPVSLILYFIVSGPQSWTRRSWPIIPTKTTVTFPLKRSRAVYRVGDPATRLVGKKDKLQHYDWLYTEPAQWRFLCTPTRRRRPPDSRAISPGCVMLVCHARLQCGQIRRRRAVHWRTPEIAALRVACVVAQRLYQRTIRRALQKGKEAERTQSTNARKALYKAIKRSQEWSWALLCERVEHDL